jgi:hypothetical protein
VTALPLAVLIPLLFWDGGVETAPALTKAGIQQIAVLPEHADQWRTQLAIEIKPFNPQGAVKLKPPETRHESSMASASRAPWVESNGWRMLRDSKANFYYDARGASGVLAAAEAFMFGANAAVHTDQAGFEPLCRMLVFLNALAEPRLEQLANIGYVDDGSRASAEVMNLFVRRNLLFKIVPQPDPSLDLTVQLGTANYSKKDAMNPGHFAELVRGDLTDEKRLLRIYGSNVVIGRLEGDANHVRVHLMNCDPKAEAPPGVRVRVKGVFAKHRAAIFGDDSATLEDFSADAAATEFTVPHLAVYAVVDLSR